ncbi:MAG: tetratricopeptide repeat protein [Bacteroidota bacterium]
MKFLHCICLCALLLLCTGQSLYAKGPDFNEKSILLKRSLPTAKGMEAVKILLELSEGYHRLSIDSAARYADSALVMMRLVDNPVLQAKVYDNLGKVHYRENRYIIAKGYFERAAEYAAKTNDERLMAVINNSLAISSKKNGEYEKALSYYRRSLEFFENKNDSLVVVRVQLNISSLKIELEQYQSAIEYLTETERLSNILNDERLIGRCLNNLGRAFEGLGDYEKAIVYYLDALNVRQRVEKGKPSRTLLSTISNIFSVYTLQGKNAEAEYYYQRAWRMAKELDSQYWLHYLQMLYGDYMNLRGEKSRAISFYRQSLEMAEALGETKSILDLREKLATTYSELERFEEAYTFRVQYDELRERLFNEKSTKQIAETEAKYELDQKEEKIQNLIASEDRRSTQMYFLIALAVLALIAMVAVYSRYHLRQETNRQLALRSQAVQRQNELLELKNQEIQSQNKLLEQQSEAIQYQNQLLQQSNRDLEHFAFAASHDLKEPLRSIRSYMQLLERRYTDKLDDKGKQFINFASEGAIRMDRLLQDLLEYSRIGRSEVSPVDVDLNVIIGRIERNLNLLIEETSTIITTERLPKISGYETELYQLFQNLVSNAIKFQKPGVSPIIHIGAQETSRYWEISVQDNGIGIDPAFKDKVFAIFQRLHGREEYEGTGIGLAICQKVVQHHDGSIDFHSVKGKGTRFLIRLPKVS